MQNIRRAVLFINFFFLRGKRFSLVLPLNEAGAAWAVKMSFTLRKEIIATKLGSGRGKEKEASQKSQSYYQEREDYMMHMNQIVESTQHL